MDNYRKLLAENVRHLMDSRPELNSQRKLAAKCRKAKRKVGARTIGHLLNAEDGPMPRLDTIVAVAEAFGVPPWSLLLHDLGGQIISGTRVSEVLPLAIRIAQLPQDQVEALMSLLEGTDRSAGVIDISTRQPQNQVHQPLPPYGPRNR